MRVGKALGEASHLGLNSGTDAREPLVLNDEALDLAFAERRVAGKHLGIQVGLGLLDRPGGLGLRPDKGYA